MIFTLSPLLGVIIVLSPVDASTRSRDYLWSWHLDLTLQLDYLYYSNGPQALVLSQTYVCSDSNGEPS
jgi:hypothetical protein